MIVQFPVSLPGRKPRKTLMFSGVEPSKNPKHEWASVHAATNEELHIVQLVGGWTLQIGLNPTNYFLVYLQQS